MRLSIVVEGKIRSDFIKDGVREYARRLLPYVSLDISEVKKFSLREKKAGRLYVCMDRKGKEMNSLLFSEWLMGWGDRGIKEIVFFIGGIHGVPIEILNIADEVLSMSKMTFTHEFALLILLEQIYRGIKIARGEPYHY